jgi:hypothetical protein
MELIIKLNTPHKIGEVFKAIDENLTYENLEIKEEITHIKSA